MTDSSIDLSLGTSRYLSIRPWRTTAAGQLLGISAWLLLGGMVAILKGTLQRALKICSDSSKR